MAGPTVTTVTNSVPRNVDRIFQHFLLSVAELQICVSLRQLRVFLARVARDFFKDFCVLRRENLKIFLVACPPGTGGLHFLAQIAENPVHIS